MKHILIALFITSLSTTCFSQKVRFGFTASPVFGFANLEQKPNSLIQYDDAKGQTGITYGILTDFDLSGEERYYLHSGVLFEHTGLKINGTIGGVGGSTAFEESPKVTYLEIPLSLKLKTNPMGYLRYYGQFGLNNDIKISEKIDNGQITDIEKYNTFNIGLNMGAGTEYDFSQQTSGVFGVYYNNAFSDAIDNQQGSIKLSQLGLRFGIYF